MTRNPVAPNELYRVGFRRTQEVGTALDGQIEPDIASGDAFELEPMKPPGE